MAVLKESYSVGRSENLVADGKALFEVAERVVTKELIQVRPKDVQRVE